MLNRYYPDTLTAKHSASSRSPSPPVVREEVKAAPHATAKTHSFKNLKKGLPAKPTTQTTTKERREAAEAAAESSLSQVGKSMSDGAGLALVNEYSDSLRLQKEQSQAKEQMFPRADPQAIHDLKQSLDLEDLQDPEAYLHK